MISIPNTSHKQPTKYRVKYEDADKVFAGNYFQDKTLPVKYSSSKVALIGGGFSGIAAAIKCIKVLKVDDFVLFEKHADFGGTWFANTYPGCASDIPAVWYSLSTDMSSTWSGVQPPQYELEEYLLAVVKKYNIRPHARFQTAVEKVVYNEAAANWTMFIRDLTNGQLTEHTSTIIISSTGGLVVPLHLKSKGLKTFKGRYMHSALYDHSVSLKGKKVVVVGAGCSACQLIPQLLDNYEPESLVQIARSTQYIMPPIPSILQKVYNLFAKSYLAIKFLRFFVLCVAETKFPMFKGMGFLSRIVRRIERATSLRYMNSKCPEKYKKDIIPEFHIGCKRLVYDHDYMDALKDTRFDLDSSDIEEITEDAVVLKSGRVIKADVIIACTGYDLSKSFELVQIIGRNGFNATKMWTEEAPSAYQTVLIKHVPNLFIIGGPNIATGHSSFVESCENALTFATLLAKRVLDGTHKSVCVKTEEYDNWFVTIQAELRKSVFGTAFGGCRSWYSKDGLNYTTYPYSQFQFWWRCNHPILKHLDFEPVDKK